MSNTTNSTDWVVKDTLSGRVVAGPMALDEAQDRKNQLTESASPERLEVVQILNG